MNGRIKFRFIRNWTDINKQWSVGDEILLSEELVSQAKARMEKYGKLCDLVVWGSYYRVPLSFLEPA